MTCTCSIHSPFRWAHDPRVSRFATDPTFTGYATGKSKSQTSSETVTRAIERTGRSPGSIMGISKVGDKLVETGNHQRRARRG